LIDRSYRGRFGATRAAALAAIPLPPDPMPSHRGARALKAWRYVGAFGPELMLCVAQVRIGRARQSFWAVWDRLEGRLHERTVIGRGGVQLATGRAGVLDRGVEIQLQLQENAGVECVCPYDEAYGWTRKQGGVAVSGAVTIDGRTRRLRDMRAVIDDTAAYYPRHTVWRWSAGVGRSRAGAEVAWNLVRGVNDPPGDSERTVWVDGVPREVGPSTFAEDLSGVDELRFEREAVRARRDNMVLVRSSYRQPFGTFSGRLPDGTELAEGYGVMEEHEAWW
jgi:hypothetical protein